MQADDPERDSLRSLLEENQQLLAENNELLRSIRRTQRWSFYSRLIWVAIIIGLPFIFYYFIVEPYFATFGSSIETFEQGLREIPGWKQFYESVQERQSPAP
ncbi:MAG: hypothetical protein ACOC4E_02725 [Patescibacteria group bacterium]